jgi:hypothetical protein
LERLRFWNANSFFATVVILIGLVSGFVPVWNSPPSIFKLPRLQQFPLEERSMAVGRNGYMLQYYFPTSHSRCGDSELPCMPYPKEILMRDTKDMSRGFVAEN